MTLSWYKSLYWRVALGLIAFLALMLAAEAALFLWTTDRIAGSMPARSPRRLAVLVASDLGTALAADPKLDLEKYVREQYGNVLQMFVVIMRDGRVVANDQDIPQEYLVAARRAATDPRTFESPRFFGPSRRLPSWRRRSRSSIRSRIPAPTSIVPTADRNRTDATVVILVLRYFPDLHPTTGHHGSARTTRIDRDRRDARGACRAAPRPDLS
jgi:hypothetical protein